MNPVTDALAIIRQHRRSYFILNGVYYGLVIAALIYAQFDRAVHRALLEAVGAAFGGGSPLGPVLDAYRSGRVIPAVGLTFAVNLVLGSFAAITLPSLVIPFSGLLVAGYRAVLWGLLYSPEPGAALTGRDILFGVLAAGLLLLEGQGYVLATLATFLQGRALLWPKKVGEESRWRGYLSGLRLTGKLYVLVAIVLLIAAMYEVLVVVLVLP